MKKDHIDKKISDAMNSLDGISRATASPYLMTRINAGLSKTPATSVWARIISFMSKPAFALMALFFVMLVNLVIIFSGELNQNNNTTASATSNQGVYEMAINVSSNYDFENQEP